MRFLLFVLLFLSFAYSLGLVLANNTEVGVNLLFSQAPTMNLGLLLILCLILGIIIGILLALLIFRVLQNKWEISRLQKANANLQEQLNQANVVIDRQASAPTVEEAVYGARSIDMQDTTDTHLNEGGTLSKRK
ncbi:MAG: lipopolysaccharide assembly protein LapA domain-containing protein [Psychrobacter sp.]|uniref:lipopolysaccharide assembly protein LapA domain-containing protein n=1 Tax=Psychrobacter sp. TaxID=56811 RepID=UPI002647860E|nr:lipopolysaccharide assembly protein LapA domain-containing protein [Psychrobacter sp.]MDN5620031.1 lipopolysaccharide assembly protein LapA domain-containing protein [Psychrobacter sp.]